jgi:hypothetical protein
MLSALTPTTVAAPVGAPSEQPAEPAWNPARVAAG